MPTEVVGVVDQFYGSPTVPAYVLADPEYTEHGDMPFYESFEELRATKLEEGSAPGSRLCAHKKHPDSIEPSLRESIRTEGILEEIRIQKSGGKFCLFNGHHRVFCAADIDPDFPVPVRWD